MVFYLIKLPYLLRFLYVFKQTGLSNTIDYEQTPQNVASDQDLYYLSLTQQFYIHENEILSQREFD